MHSALQKILIAFLIFTGHIAMAQLKFTASVSSPQICKNELLQLKLTVENAKDVQQITPPVFKNFIVVSGPNQESGMTMINGDVKQFIALTYILKPKAPGNFSIAAATAKADGKVLKSNSVVVKVSNKLADKNSGGNNLNSPFSGISPYSDAVTETAFNDNILRKGESAEEKVNKNMFIKLDLDKTSCYVGEPIIATYKLYTRLKSESNLIKNPSFNGFSVIDLQQPDNVNYTREKVNGREYNVYIIRRAQLYPLQAGNLELEPAEIENNISFIKEEYARRQTDLMSEMLREFQEASIPAEGLENRKLTLRSKPASVTVKALPDINVPASFKGAVGNFAVEAMLEKNSFSTDDAGKLKLIISGQGNLQLVNSPEIQWPQGFEAFEPSTSDALVKTTVPVSGRKIIEYSFTVLQPGAYTLPAVKFSYFDPRQGKYKTDSTGPVSFTVTKGTGEKVKPVEVNKTAGDSFLNKFISNRRWVISTIVVLILGGLIFWLKRDTTREIAIEKEKLLAAEKKEAEQKVAEAAIPEEKNWLEKAHGLLHGESVVFYNELNYALKSYLAKKLQLPVETISKKNITEELDKKNITVDTAIQLQQLLNDIELQLYAPFAEKEKMEELYNSTADIIQLLDTYKS